MKVALPRPSTTPPSVTVVIPCYKYGHYLPDVVGTTLAQEGVDVDVIIVDDASPDDSGQVAQDIAFRDPRVRVIAHETNKRHIATYNDGLAAATGKYVVLLSADDLLAPGSLERSTALMEAYPDVDFVYGYSPDFDVDPPVPGRTYQYWSIWSGDEWIDRICERASNVVSNPEVVMRRETMDAIGGYDARFPHTADLLVWLQAAARGSVGRVNGPDQAYYRVHGANMHITDFGSVVTDLRERRQTFDAFLDGDVRDHPRRDEWVRRSRRAMAVEATRWAVRSFDTEGMSSADLMSEYADIAVELWPDVVRTSLWRRYARRRANGHASRIDRLSFQADWQLRHKLRWRRWRRFGT